MNFLVVGLGSMGKRRIRCLKKLGFNNIYGFDMRKDRRDQVKEVYNIPVYDEFEMALKENPDALIISVPPDVHHIYMKEAIKHNIHFFVEASVLDTDFESMIASLKEKSIVAAPSATLLFHPAIKKISEIIKENKLGKISNILLHSGQYLPDWHTYEEVSEYYVSQQATGGAREIVPFELTWLTAILGFPKKVVGNYRKTININGASSIDDTYNFLLDYDNFLASITVDVVSRNATRRLLINGQNGQLIWDWDLNEIKVFIGEKKEWEHISYKMDKAEEGYNSNIGENMYIDEMANFVNSIKGTESPINNLEKDYKVLKLLYAIEASEENSSFVRFEI